MGGICLPIPIICIYIYICKDRAVDKCKKISRLGGRELGDADMLVQLAYNN